MDKPQVVGGKTGGAMGSILILVGVFRMVKTNAVLVQHGAKVNSKHYCYCLQLVVAISELGNPVLRTFPNFGNTNAGILA